MTDMLENQNGGENTPSECGCSCECCANGECETATQNETAEAVEAAETAEVTEAAEQPEEAAAEAAEHQETAAEEPAEAEASADEETKEPQPETAAAAAEEPKKKSRMWIIAAVLVAVAVLVFGGIKLAETNDTVASIFGIETEPLSGKQPVMTIGDYEVSRDEYLYYILVGKEQVEYYYPGLFDSTPELFDSLKESVETSLKSAAAIEAWAKDLDAELTEDEIAEVDSYIDQVRQSYASDIEYVEALSEAHLTEELYRKLMLEQSLASKVSQAALADEEFSTVTDDELHEYARENEIIGAKHILLLTSGDETNDAAVLARAQALLDRINGGEDFDTLMNENTEDPGIDTYPDGYTFGPDTMVEEFDTAARALEVGEVSELVKSSYGYHIIKRVEPDYESLKDSLLSDRITSTLEEYAEKLKVKYVRGYDEITLDDCVAASGGTTADDTATDDATADGTTDTADTTDGTDTTASQG